jgi:capsular exopolysaccharide synthesis family protein
VYGESHYDSRGNVAPLEAEPRLLEVLPAVRRRLWLILLVAFLFAGAAVGFDLLRTPVYEASARLLVGAEPQEPALEDQQDSLSNSSVQGLQQVTRTMAQAAGSRPVAQEVIELHRLQTTPEGLLAKTSIEQVEDTQFIQLIYRDTDPARARDVVNTLGVVASGRISEASASASNIRATVWEYAEAPRTPVSPKPVRDGLLAAALGLLLGLGLALLLERLDDTWRSPEEVERVARVPTFGFIPRVQSRQGHDNGSGRPSRTQPSRGQMHERAGFDAAQGEDVVPSGELVTLADGAGAVSEAYRMLRASLFYALADTPPEVIVLTSPAVGECNSITCANLGVALAQAGKKTLILDCDLRSPKMHIIFGLRKLRGLSDILARGQEAPEIWQEPVPGLKVITSGPLPPNPAELVTSQRLAQLLDRMRQAFDYVLLDTPPVTLFSDPAVLAAAHCDGVLLVLDAQNTRRGALRQALRRLEGVGANVLGTVVNNAEAPKGEYRYHGYPHDAKAIQ